MSVLDCSHCVLPTGINHQSWTFTAPPHWQRRRLRSLCKVNPSATTKLRTMAGSTEVSFLPMELARAGSPELAPRTAALADVRSGFTPFLDGDLLIAKITPCFENGKGGIADNLLNGIGFGSTEFHVLRPGPEIDVRFLYYATIAEPFREIGVRMMRGSAGQQRVPVEFLNDFVMVFPDIRTQRLIAQFLDRYMRLTGSLIRAKRRQIELLNEQKQAIIQSAVTRGLDPNVRLKPSGVWWLGDIPEHWRLIPLKYLSRRVQNGTTPPTDQTQYYEGGSIPWFGPSSIDEEVAVGAPVRFLSELAFSDGRARVIEGPALLIVVIGATAGKSGLLLGVGSTNQQLTAYELRTSDVSPEFAAYQVRMSEHWLKSTASAATIPIIDASTVSRIPIALPSLGEQERILTRVNRIVMTLGRAISHLREQIDLLREYRTRLIADVVTGKLDVRDVELPDLEDADIDDLGDSDFNSDTDQDDLPDAEEVEADGED